jgi:predicted ATPase/class 3 adenylate cyclase
VTEEVAASAARPLPTGTVTFLRTDVEGSMALSRALGPRWDGVNDTHLRLIRRAVEGADGVVVRTEGDAVFAAFQEAGAGVRAAAAAQRALADAEWPDGTSIRVRMGVHSGEAHLAGDDYGGYEVSRAARVAATGHGGQVLLSGAAQALVADDLPDGTELLDLGTFVLKDVPRPERIFQLEVTGLPTTFPPLRAARTTVGNLDERLTTFVGRDGPVRELQGLLATARLITLTGPGGIGKSSLALEAARSAQHGFADGAWFVPLATIDAADGVGPLVARTLGLFDGSQSSAADTLPRFVADRSMLFVLDNFEHVMDAATLVNDLVRWSPASRVMVTSRTPLRVSGEQEYPVTPLGIAVPTGDDGVDDGSPARRLFVDRARAVRPAWDPGPDAAIVDEICRLVDGLPLGIELAAARVAILPLGAIRDRLAASLPLPGGGSRDAPERQRTLEATVEWSHGLLTPNLQRAMHRLSVFDGGADVEQIGAVLADPDEDDGPAGGSIDALDALAQLVEHSLLERDPAPIGVRFRMLRTIQAFAAALLAADEDEQAIRHRHARAFLVLAAQAKQYEGTLAQVPWIERLSIDEANLRSAVRWAIEHDTMLALELVAALWRFWQADGHLTEARELADRALASPEAAAPSVERMWAVSAAGSIAYWQADAAAAHSRYQEQLALARMLDDERGVVDALFNLGHTQFIQQARGDPDYATALAVLEDVVARYRDLGDERGVIRAEWAGSNVLLDQGRNEAATEQMKSLLAEFERIGDAQYHAMALGSLSWSSFMGGRSDESIGYAARALRESYDMRDLGTTTISIHVGVLIALIMDRPEVAAQLTGAFEAASERYGVNPPAGLERFLAVQDPFQTARAALSPERWEIEYTAGRRMSLGEAVEAVESMAAEL